MERRPLPALRATYRGPAGPILLKTLHRRVFRALDAPEGEGFWKRCRQVDGRYPFRVGGTPQTGRRGSSPHILTNTILICRAGARLKGDRSPFNTSSSYLPEIALKD